LAHDSLCPNLLANFSPRLRPRTLGNSLDMQYSRSVVMLVALLVQMSVQAAVMTNAPLPKRTKDDQAACLLQNQFASGDVAVEEDHAVIKRHGELLDPASLFEADSFEASTMDTIRLRSIARSKSCMAHLSLLHRATKTLEISRNISNKKLYDMVDGFIKGQSGSRDAASSQLMEAKHQLNQIHQYVHDLAVEVNATERAIMALDKELQTLLQQMKDLDKWKAEQLAECARKKAEAIAMYGKLSEEMKEMKNIANPSVAMDIHSGKISEASALQTSVRTAMHNAGPKDAPVKQRNATADSERLQVLIQGTQSAASQVMKCMGHGAPHSMSLLAAAFSQAPEEGEKTPTAEECEEEKEKLHEVYVKTYVELARLKDEYSELANSTACEDTVLSEFAAKKAPIQEDIDSMLKAIDEKVKALQRLRPRLEAASEAEKKMREQVAKLEDEVGALPETISDLGKVRDAIQALSRCPGLSRVQFHLPVWTMKWATFDQDATAQDDKKQDDLMDAICDKQQPGARAAEVGEIEELTVEQIPLTNTAEAPLLGACPMCEGEESDSYADKHARLCWEPGKKLNHEDKSKTCGKGQKAILCVMDRPEFRKIPA